MYVHHSFIGLPGVGAADSMACNNNNFIYEVLMYTVLDGVRGGFSSEVFSGNFVPLFACVHARNNFKDFWNFISM